MALIGAGFRGGFFEARLVPSNPAGLGIAVGGAVAMFLGNQLILALVAVILKFSVVGGEPADLRSMVIASLMALLPAAIPVVFAAWWLAGRRGGKPMAVLNLRDPELGSGGWAIVIGGFFFAMLAVMYIVLSLSGVDFEKADSETGGMVKDAMLAISHEPRLFLLVLPSVVLGAPLAEELIFRGQIYSALSQTRLGFSGASLVTALLWALGHIGEGWIAVGVIFAMGLVFGWMLCRFGSLRVTFACHAAWNLIQSLMALGAVSQ